MRRLDFANDFISKGVEASVAAHLDELEGKYFGRDRQVEFQRFLLEKIRTRSPIAVVRTGDGEGNVMLSSDPQGHNELANFAFSRIWHHMFGKHSITEDQKSSFIADFIGALSDADILGVPTAQQIGKRLNNIVNGHDKDIRGASGVISNWYWLDNNPSIFRRESNYFGIWHYHIGLGENLQALLTQSEYTSAITCYPELLYILEQKYACRKGMLIDIPPQSANIKATPDERHYPDRYLMIRQNIAAMDLSGHTFLVGAGLLGKIYCTAIKQAGGIAIDIGSLIDVLVGKSVRRWQTTAVLERYQSVRA